MGGESSLAREAGGCVTGGRREKAYAQLSQERAFGRGAEKSSPT